ncbi:MAG: metal-sensing transcriptional repressor [Ruminococcus sp.]|nr:metal-sensing transcriptional repressor [Ruminococcus sp.]
MKECRCHQTKTRDEAEVKSLMNRLNRIEGQIRGIKKMIENGAYCPDILIQAAAAGAALNAFNKELLAGHIRTCVVTDVKDGREDTVDELVDTIRRMMR